MQENGHSKSNGESGAHAPSRVDARPKEMAKLRELVDGFDHAMLVTRSEDGEVRARPMRIVAQQSGGTLVFVTHRGDEKVDEMASSPQVCVTLQDGRRFVSLSGEASLDDSSDRIGLYYDVTWEPWFPEGVADPDILLVDVAPTHAEYWDGSGLDRLTFVFAAAKAMAKGESLTPEVTEHAKLEIAGRS